MSSGSDTIAEMLDSRQARELGRSLRRIRDDVVAQPASGRIRQWYQGAGKYFDLFLERPAHSDVDWLQMALAGRYVECDLARRHLVTGDTGDWEPRVVAHPHSHRLSPDAEPDFELLDDLIRIVGARANEAPFDALSTRLREFRASVDTRSHAATAPIEPDER